MNQAFKLGRVAPFNCKSYGNLISTRPISHKIGVTSDNKTYLLQDSKLKSFWHDVPLRPSDEKNVFNMVVEIPRWTNAKNEINKKEYGNPIVQDQKNGKPRFVHDIFPYKGYIWNYGALPQTYEDPETKDKFTGCIGDGDPVDVIEIGSKLGVLGEIKKVKILGTVCLIDGDETDWKIIAIDVNDPISNNVRSVGDLESVFPGLLSATKNWFTDYKIPDGKPKNSWGLEGQAKDVDFALSVIEESHLSWKSLISLPANQEKFGMLKNESVTNSFQYELNLSEKQHGSLEARDQGNVNKWYYINDGRITNK